MMGNILGRNSEACIIMVKTDLPELTTAQLCNLLTPFVQQIFMCSGNLMSLVQSQITWYSYTWAKYIFCYYFFLLSKPIGKLFPE